MSVGRAISGELVADVTPLLLVGIAGYIAYLWLTNTDWFNSGAPAAIAQQIESVLPRPITMGNPIGKGPTGAYFTKGGTLVVPNGDNNGTPVSYGSGAQVPGTGQTVAELHSIGYSEDDIAALIVAYAKNPAAYGG